MLGGVSAFPCEVMSVQAGSLSLCFRPRKTYGLLYVTLHFAFTYADRSKHSVTLWRYIAHASAHGVGKNHCAVSPIVCLCL